MIIDHICHAVINLDEGVKYWEEIFGYKRLTRPVVNPAQKVKVIFLWKENSVTVKLIEPLKDNVQLLSFVRRGGGGLHHICFRCERIRDSVDELTSKGFTLVSPPFPGEAFNCNDIAFLVGRFGLNIELIDTVEKAELV